MVETTDVFFPKLNVPFKRTEKDGNLVVTQTVKKPYEWVFENPNEVTAVEKLDGENLRVDIDTDSGKPIAMYKRDGFEETEDGRVYNLMEIPLWSESYSHYTEGIINAYGNGWIDSVSTGPSFGELVGPKIQGNRYDLEKHYWVPFEYAVSNLSYKSYGEYGVEFEDVSNWFTDGLMPLFYSKMNGGLDFDTARQECTSEGVVFIQKTDDGPLWEDKMAKLRRSDFQWYYE